MRLISKLFIGDKFTATKIFTKEEVLQFANLTEDTNLIHCDSEYVKSKFNFDGCVVHGALINGFIAGIIGKKLPGTFLFSQETKFQKPLIVDEQFTANITIDSIKKQFAFCTLTCVSCKDNEVILKGKAVFKQT